MHAGIKVNIPNEGGPMLYFYCIFLLTLSIIVRFSRKRLLDPLNKRLNGDTVPPPYSEWGKQRQLRKI